MVIVYMDDPSPSPVRCSVPLRTVHISSSDHDVGLPLARARNAAAAAANTPNLVFLDVDSIPAASLFSAFITALNNEKVLAMAKPRYLRKALETSQVVDDEQLFERSVRHHTRAGLPTETTMSRHEMFWSLGFAMHASAFFGVGGFDEGYSGYGGEDTDFAFRVRESGIPIRFVEEPVFHQHHGVYVPPLNHFTAIICNARLFRARWGVWPMEGWLKEFMKMGLISWSPSESVLTVRRTPTPQEIDNAFSFAAY
ncbi:GT2 family glycosyltransferase [Arthrobacter sp. UYEF3]